ncbi:unnamed protein product [Strongylus vulgaris]|uniref:Uncharacterized protein n=1 Tax=Strongylus vulgaris TaxID=40348 RepID=A0A3P7JN70_STRVU|nr:unnamed protein product [Strongylus vulgaris]
MPHVTRAQLSKVRDRSQAVASAERLLECVPQCMLTFPEICSEDTMSLYLQEGAQLVEKRARSCSAWKWRYDGVHPSPLLFRGDSDDEPTLHTVVDFSNKICLLEYFLVMKSSYWILLFPSNHKVFALPSIFLDQN